MEEYEWSKNVQGILTLDKSREIRFKDKYKEIYINALNIETGNKILDVGCGPGTLTRKISKWLNNDVEIIGLDNDNEFIMYADNKAKLEKLKNIEYIKGDALNIPLKDNSMDIVTSHTVIEHVPNREFLQEQKRVCKKGGYVSVMSVRTEIGFHTLKEGYPPASNREKQLFNKFYKLAVDKDKQHKIGAYNPKPIELLNLFEELNFSNIQVDFIPVTTFIDDSRNTKADKIEILDSQRQCLLDGLRISVYQFPDVLTGEEIDELKDLINQRYKFRLDLIEENRNVWDISLSTLMVVCGKK